MKPKRMKSMIERRYLAEFYVVDEDHAAKLQRVILMACDPEDAVGRIRRITGGEATFTHSPRLISTEAAHGAAMYEGIQILELA